MYFSVFDMSDTVRVCVSHPCDAARVHFAIFQPDDHHWLFVKLCHGSDVDHVVAGQCFR